MRRVVCRFEDESDFLRQFHWERAADAVDNAAIFMFVGEFSLDVGEQFQFTALVSAHREQCQLNMTVLDRIVEYEDDSDTLAFRYCARIEPEDAVWLLAFRQKLSTRRWLEELAA